jgi:hypothetical protein
MPAAAAAEGGFLYGKVTAHDGKSWQGRLRWDDEEAFWGDFFNSSKEHSRWAAEAPGAARQRHRHTVELFGFRLGSFDDGFDDGRQFVSRFGDIARIEPKGGDRVAVTLKSGTRFELDGGSNDVDATVTVWDAHGKVEVPWRRIRTIELMPAPVGIEAPVRLYGTVTTKEGPFTGFVQWDQEECTAGDELDGETADGDESIRMETIRSIERQGRHGSAVTLLDGRQVTLSDTNDVDHSNRGIYVEDPRYGRVLVSWDTFLRVDFSRHGSGPAYAAFGPGERLAGEVTTADGRKLIGHLVYDLDESETTEMLDGERRDVEYSIPFALVASVVPRAGAAKVTLKSGEELLLEDATDVTDDNAGVLVFEPGKPRPTYVAWEDVERIDFAAPAKR